MQRPRQELENSDKTIFFAAALVSGTLSFLAINRFLRSDISENTKFWMVFLVTFLASSLGTFSLTNQCFGVDKSLSDFLRKQELLPKTLK